METNQQYIVSARKYRPDSFESLIGQDNIVRTLKNSVKRGQLAHAYLFCGPRGVGKTSAARIFAKMINCAHPDEDMEPCGECESCVSFREGRSFCIHELDAASNNGVDAMKDLMEQVQIPPQVGRYSVYIIDEVHMLSTSAFNAFLKTLEEPPAHAIFILATTEKHKILPTILSRCQTYDFNRIGISDIVLNLRKIAVNENITIDDESLHVIARKADGAMRDALTIFDQTVAFCGTAIQYEDVIRNLNVLNYENCFELVDSFLKGDHAAALLKFNDILSKGFNALHFISALSSHFRDLLVAGSGGLDSLLEYSDSLKEKYREQASRCTLKFLYEALAITVQCESGYRMSVNPRLSIEFALMRLCALCGKFQSAAAPAPSAAPAPAAPAARPAAAPSSAAPAVAPAPVAQPEPKAEEPRPRRRATRTGAGLSISNILQDSSQSQPVAQTASPGEPIPQDDVLMSCWKGFATDKDFAAQPRLVSVLSKAEVEITLSEDVKILKFFVQNKAQEQWIREKILRTLESKMHKSLNSSRVRLDVDVVPDTGAEEKKVYLPQEKAAELMSHNSEVGELIKDFNLDVK